MASLTAANALITLTVPGIFNTPVTISGFSTDNVYSTQDIEAVQTQMGVDGRLSGGFVYSPIVQVFSLMADSASTFFFQQWNDIQLQLQDPQIANGATTLHSTGQTYVSTRGFLSTISPMPTAGKILQARQWTVTWERVIPSAV